MTRPRGQKESRSLRLYARLLELYLPTFLRRHRVEMVQNSADFEGAAESKAEFWLLTRKDLTMSLISQLPRRGLVCTRSTFLSHEYCCSLSDHSSTARRSFAPIRPCKFSEDLRPRC